MKHKIRAKVNVNSVQEGFGPDDEKVSESVNFHAVYSDDPNDPNYEWSEATPHLSGDMTINNPKAFNFFQRDQEYYLDFVVADDDEDA